MRLSYRTIAIIVIAAFVTGIGSTMIAGVWRTESSKIPVTYTTGEFEGEYNPADIRGSYTFANIASSFKVPVDVLAAAFGVSDRQNPGEFQIKELEEIYGELEQGEIGTDSIRWFVSLYAGLPFTPEETTLLPNPSIQFIKDKLDEDRLAGLLLKTVTLAEAAVGVSVDHTSDSEVLDEREIKGKTTFKDLLDWGATEEAIETALGVPMGPTGVAVRDFCIENGIEFSTVKSKLQLLIDNTSN